MRHVTLGMGIAVLTATFATAADFDAATAFGARETVRQLRLSPDGKSVAYIGPANGQGSVLFTMRVADPTKPVAAMVSSRRDETIENCNWVANDRLTCTIVAVSDAADQHMYVTRLVAVDADGKNFRMISDRVGPFSATEFTPYGGTVLDRLTESASVLMERYGTGETFVESHMAVDKEGLRVDRVDTRTGVSASVETPSLTATGYLTDGRGTVRVMRVRGRRKAGYDTSISQYLFRRPGSSRWEPLCSWDPQTHEGFEPLAVDGNAVVGIASKDGFLAAYRMVLDGTAEQTLLYAPDKFDVDGIRTFGYTNRVVGVEYSGEYSHTEYTDPGLKALIAGLHKALPGKTSVAPIDASLDEKTLLFYTGSDTDPGVYYLFDREARRLQTFLVVRSPLEGVTLSEMTPVRYPARDGVEIPGYLTLPPGHTDAKGLPAIVLPHGGPSARDYWGFDWLAQFYAHQGYAVLQPNFRGSAGYGEAWFRENGFRNWRTAINDVVDGAKWLSSAEGADPQRMAIVGWSYGGYAALQAAITEPGVFKAVVAIAPVTDLEQLREERRRWTDFAIVSEMIGTGSHVRDGSPALHARQLDVPVLLFHGDHDVNVAFEQSRRMIDALDSAGRVPHELVTFAGLDHYLDDSAARTELLRHSDAFLKKILMP